MPNRQWHPAFIPALREALKDAPPGQVEIIPEVALSSRPLGVDILVVKKTAGIVLAHPMARSFRRYNLIEYKSPVDYLEANDYDKGLAITYLYKALNHPGAATLEEITLNFISSTHPRAMLTMLAERGLEIEENQPVGGIYAIREVHFPVQVVVLDELEEVESSYMFAAFLTRQEKKSRAGSLLLQRYIQDPADRDLKELAEFMLENEAEPQVIEEMMNMAYQMPAENKEKLIELFNRHPLTREWIEKKQVEWLQEGIEKGIEEGARAAILEFLEGRFGKRPAEAEAALEELQGVDRLQELRRQIFREDSLEGCLELLRKATNGAPTI